MVVVVLLQRSDADCTRNCGHGAEVDKEEATAPLSCYASSSISPSMWVSDAVEVPHHRLVAASHYAGWTRGKKNVWLLLSGKVCTLKEERTCYAEGMT